MIPFVPIYPNCLAMRFKIYDSRFTMDHTLENKAGYCLVIMQDFKLYYLKQTNNLSTYLKNIASKIRFKENLPICLKNTLNRNHTNPPVVYYIVDELPSTLQQIHNMLSPVGWINMITPRGREIKQNKAICRINFNHGLCSAISIDGDEYTNSKYMANASKRALKALKERLSTMRSPKMMERIKHHFDMPDLKTFINSLTVMHISITPHIVQTNKIPAVIRSYNDDCALIWINGNNLRGTRLANGISEYINRLDK